MIKQIITNLHRSWISSALGIGFIVAGVYSAVSAKQTWTDSWLPIGAGLVMLGLKDPHK